MDAFTTALLQKGHLPEIECWHEIAHAACKFTHRDPPPHHQYWFWSNLYWDTIEIVRLARHQPNPFDLSQDLNVDQLVDHLGHVGLRVITFE